VDALTDLFAEHGAPLMMKRDSGVTKHFIVDWDVFTLYSPRYCARYNGAYERANRTLKEFTAHIAEQADRPNFWKCEDLLAARLRANRLSQLWGPTGSRSWNAGTHAKP
jgi:hypothetical protein